MPGSFPFRSYVPGEAHTVQPALPGLRGRLDGVLGFGGPAQAQAVARSSALPPPSL